MMPQLLAIFLWMGSVGCSPVQPVLSVETAYPDEWTQIPTAALTPTQIFQLEKVATATFSPSVTVDRFAGLASSIEDVVEKSGGNWFILIQEVGGSVIYARGEHERIHPASVIKVPIAMLFFSALEQEVEPEDLIVYLQDHGTDGRSYDQLLKAMLVKSEEPAAEILLAWTQQRLRIDNRLADWDMNGTTLEPRRTTLTDLARIYRGLYEGEWISAQARAIILERMAEYTPNDELRLGKIRSCQTAGDVFYNKRGTLTEDVLIVGDAAIFERADKIYFVGVFAYQASASDEQTTYERLEAGMADFSAALCDYFGGLQ